MKGPKAESYRLSNLHVKPNEKGTSGGGNGRELEDGGIMVRAIVRVGSMVMVPIVIMDGEGEGGCNDDGSDDEV